MCAAKSFCVVSVVALLLASAGFAQADAIPVTILNPSFESPTPLTDDDSYTGRWATPTSWTMVTSSGNSGMFDLSMTGGPGPNVSSIPDGNQAIWGNTTYEYQSYFYQVLDTTLQANTTYTLTVYAGARSDLSFTLIGGLPATTINLGYGDTHGANLLTAATSDCPVPAQGTWEKWTVTFETGADPEGLGEALRVEININNIQPLFDNVQLTADTIPEPGTMALLAAGLIGLLAYAWRRRR